MIDDKKLPARAYSSIYLERRNIGFDIFLQPNLYYHISLQGIWADTRAFPAFENEMVPTNAPGVRETNPVFTQTSFGFSS
jgi:hypothetical protein